MRRRQGKSQIIREGDALTVQRDTAVTYVDGKPVRQQTLLFEIRASVQPMNTRDLLLVPEGDRTREQYWLFVESADPDSSSLRLNDRVEIFGALFQVQSIENWGTHARARAMRIDVGSQAR